MPRLPESRLTPATDVDLSPVHIAGKSPILDALTAIVERARSKAVQVDMLERVGFPAKDLSGMAVVSQLAYHGAASPSYLAETLGFAPSGMTKLVGRMVEHGLVTQIADAEDGRSSIIVLTETGRACGARIIAYARDSLDAELESWAAEDVDAFSRLFARFAAPAAQFTADRT